MTTATTSTTADGRADQAQLPLFRLLIVVQLLAAGFFGLAPLVAPAAYATLAGFPGREELIYRLGGAASLGYAVSAALALARRSPWGELRIPVVATLTFNAAAVVGSIISIAGGIVTPIVLFVLLAASAFTALSGYWLLHDQGPAAAADPPIPSPYRPIIGLATLSAAVFGLFPLLAPTLFAQLFGVDGTDQWMFRMAGAACLGYATAGVLELRAGSYPAIGVQNAAAVTFNLFGAGSSLLALVSGQGGLLAPVIVAAAGFFTVALVLLARAGGR